MCIYITHMLSRRLRPTCASAPVLIKEQPASVTWFLQLSVSFSDLSLSLFVSLSLSLSQPLSLSIYVTPPPKKHTYVYIYIYVYMHVAFATQLCRRDVGEIVMVCGFKQNWETQKTHPVDKRPTCSFLNSCETLGGN